MIFVLAKTEPTLFLMLAEEDVTKLRRGLSTFVDHHQLGGAKFDRVIVSLHASDTAALEVVRASGHPVPQLVHPEPGPKESKCAGCQGIMQTASLFEGKCVVCWSTEAKQLRVAQN